MKRPGSLFGSVAIVISFGLLVPISAFAAAPKAGRAPKQGGSLTIVAVGSQWPGLDPATNTSDAADATYENAIFGELFELNGANKIVPDEASNYNYSDHGLQFNIFLRHNIVFSDGTPFTAQAVKSSIERDLTPKFACICDPNFSAVSSITTSGKYEVNLHLSHTYAPLASAFIGEAPNWTVDPTALTQMGEAAYAQKPVGAGPFKVKQNKSSTLLVLTRNPRYYENRKPYLSTLTIESDNSDESAYSSLQAGNAQIWSGASTIPLIQQVKAGGKFAVDVSPATGFNFVTFNSLAAPFNNITAREAIAYATDSKALVSKLYGNLYKVTESPSGPGDLFYEPKVPGYRSYNLAKAKALVKQLGGLNISLATLDNTEQYRNESTALASEWAQAGIKTSINVTTLPQVLQLLTTHHYDAIDLQWGEDIDNGINDPIFFSSSGAWSGVKDPKLDALLEQGVSETNTEARAKAYTGIAQLISQQQYAVFLYSHPTFTVTSKQVGGYGTGVPELHVEDLWRS